MNVRAERDVGVDELLDLYASVGWTSYTRSPDVLTKAIANSTYVVTARDQDGALIGLARGLSDDASVFYLQDIIVRPAHQRRGIGRQLLAACLERYRHVRQKVLLTDDDESQRLFYESFGYVRTVDFTDAPLNAYVRFDP
ncbi:GNAT family N-acetyltransferase [Phytoactinopolyspora mesophila]|uniref:GNAT family N-acetyltransferase n=1 Tax=Phytoactinopolyspora mesophila TaxID=2650750 RepID=UPI001C9E5D3C